MKKFFALTQLVLAASIFAGAAIGQTPKPMPRFERVQYVDVPPPAPISMFCFVNGVKYPVDTSWQIWGRNYLGAPWYVIGYIEQHPWGYVAVRTDGVRFPAVCQ